MASESLSYEQAREVERLLKAANLHRVRGRLADAEDDCRQALSISPKDISIREMLGDVLCESGKLDAALSEYRAAMELAPENPSLETKFAKVTLEIAERERQKAIALDMIENPHKYAVRRRSPARAVLYAIVPGLGQFYNGDLVKALVIWGVLVFFFISWAIPHHYPTGISTIGQFLYFTNPLVLVLGVLFVTAYIYGLIDAAVVAEKSSKAAKAPKK